MATWLPLSTQWSNTRNSVGSSSVGAVCENAYVPRTRCLASAAVMASAIPRALYPLAIGVPRHKNSSSTLRASLTGPLNSDASVIRIPEVENLPICSMVFNVANEIAFPSTRRARADAADNDRHMSVNRVASVMSATGPLTLQLLTIREVQPNDEMCHLRRLLDAKSRGHSGIPTMRSPSTHLARCSGRRSGARAS